MEIAEDVYLFDRDGTRKPARTLTIDEASYLSIISEREMKFLLIGMLLMIAVSLEFSIAYNKNRAKITAQNQINKSVEESD